MPSNENRLGYCMIRVAAEGANKFATLNPFHGNLEAMLGGRNLRCAIQVF